MPELTEITKKVRAILEKYKIDRRDIATMLELAPSTVNQKLNGWANWGEGEFEKIVEYVKSIRRQ